MVAIANAPVVPIINKSQFGEFVVKIDDEIAKQDKILKTIDKVNLIIIQKKRN